MVRPSSTKNSVSFNSGLLCCDRLEPVSPRGVVRPEGTFLFFGASCNLKFSLLEGSSLDICDLPGDCGCSDCTSVEEVETVLLGVVSDGLRK